MMPDLGKYAVEVGAAYGLSAVLIVGLVAVTLWRGKRVKRALDAAEGRRNA
nr:heme exporter protein CcmD [Palleronia pelagia]